MSSPAEAVGPERLRLDLPPLDLSADVLALLDAVVEIPVYGLPYSFNVANATAMGDALGHRLAVGAVEVEAAHGVVSDHVAPRQEVDRGVEPPRHADALANQSMACCFCAAVHPVSIVLSEYIRSIWPGWSSSQWHISVTLPVAASCLATVSSSVLLPTPGSPPMSVSEPRTSPPPSTRSISPMPSGRRGTSSPRTSTARRSKSMRSSPLSIGSSAGPPPSIRERRSAAFTRLRNSRTLNGLVM